jgi:hypothetical protein
MIELKIWRVILVIFRPKAKSKLVKSADFSSSESLHKKKSWSAFDGAYQGIPSYHASLLYLTESNVSLSCYAML